MQDTMNIAVGPMTILLIVWVCASMALCLAFLSVAARRVPRMEEQMAAGGELALRQATAVALGQAKTAYYPLWSKLPAPPLHAKTEKSIHSQPDDPLVSRPSIPVLHPGLGRSCLWPGWYGGDPGNYRVEIGTPGVRTGANPVAENLPPRQAVSS
jgi:hypothetical protein